MFSTFTNAARRTLAAVADPASQLRPHRLHVQILGHTVEVVVTARPIVYRGEVKDALADGDRRLILIAAAAAPAHRLFLLLYEAWQYATLYVEQPSGADRGADLFALVAESLLVDFAARGGIERLMALQAADVDKVGHVAPLTVPCRREPYTVRVSTHLVTVAVTDRPLRDDDGEPADVVCDWRNRRILIAGSAPVQRRLELVLYGVCYAWRFCHEQPRHVEAECSMFAQAAAAALEDVERQGGVAALMALKPTGDTREDGAA